MASFFPEPTGVPACLLGRSRGLRAEGRGQQQREGSHLDVSLPWGAQVAVVGEGDKRHI